MIFRHSLSFLCASLLSLSAQDEKLPTQEQKEEVEDEARFRVPAGAVISKMTVPHYAKNSKPISLLTAEEMVVQSEEILQGKDLKIWLFDKNGEVSNTATIVQAKYETDAERLTAKGEILLRSPDDKFFARGTGGIFTLKDGKILLLGPAATIFEKPSRKIKSTTMNLTPILPLTAAVQMLIAAPPTEIKPEDWDEFQKLTKTPVIPQVSSEEWGEFERLAAPRFIPDIDGVKNFEEADVLNEALARRLAEYLTSVGKTDLLLQVSAPVADQEDPLETLFKPGENHVTIKCTKGLYYDGKNYELVYLGDINFTGMGITLTCDQDLKVIFDPPPPGEKKKDDAGEEEDENKLGDFKGVGELKQFTASGKLRINGVQKGKTFYLGGDDNTRAVYDRSQNKITVRGDQLGFVHDKIRARSNDKDAWAVVIMGDDGEPEIQFSRGNWVTDVNVPKKKK